MRMLTLLVWGCSPGVGQARLDPIPSQPPLCLPSTEALFGQPPFASRSFSELEEKIRSNRVIEVGLAGPRHLLRGGESQGPEVGDLTATCTDWGVVSRPPSWSWGTL